MMNLRRGVAKYRYATSIVTPCSRSARNPSVSSARLVYSSPRDREVASTASSWSVKIDLESYSSRPISVDLPSSTEPAVANRSRSTSEVPFPLAVLHRGLGELVVPAGGAPLGDPGRGDLSDHLVDRVRVRLHGGGARRVPHGAVPDPLDERRLARPRRQVPVDRVQHAVAIHHLAVVREVDLRQLDPLPGAVVPH